MTWHILGAGSLGALWACRFAEAGMNPCLIMRNPAKLVRYQNAKGLRFNDKTYAIAAELPQSSTPISKVLVTCKAYDAADAVASIASRLTSDAYLVLLQNGLGSQDHVQALAPAARCVLGASTEGAYRPSEFAVIPAGVGLNRLGADDLPPPEWLGDLAKAQIPYEWCDNIETKLWHKFAVNCAINPLTVLYNCQNGQLLEHQAELIAVIDELKTFLIANDQPDAAAQLTEDVFAVIRATAKNYSSMHQDVAHKRRTEIDYLLGFAIRRADAQALSLPTLLTLYQRFKAHLNALGLAQH